MRLNSSPAPRFRLVVVLMSVSFLLLMPLSASANVIPIYVATTDTNARTRHIHRSVPDNIQGGSYYVDIATTFQPNGSTIYVDRLSLTFNIVGMATIGYIKLNNNSGTQWSQPNYFNYAMASGEQTFQWNVTTTLPYPSWDVPLMTVGSWPGSTNGPNVAHTDIQAIGPEYEARPYFYDAGPYAAYYYPLEDLAQRSIVRGYTNGGFGPYNTVNRAEMAGMVARGMGWDSEDHYWDWCDYYGQLCGYAWRNFTDRCNASGCVDDNLWRNVLTLAYYGVAKGYGNGIYAPFNDVLRVETMTFITRGMVVKGYWQLQPDYSYVYPNIASNSPYRQIVSTHFFFAGGGPDTNPLASWWDTYAATPREWFVRDLWTAITINEN